MSDIRRKDGKQVHHVNSESWRYFAANHSCRDATGWCWISANYPLQMYPLPSPSPHTQWERERELKFKNLYCKWILLNTILITRFYKQLNMNINWWFMQIVWYFKLMTMKMILQNRNSTSSFKIFIYYMLSYTTVQNASLINQHLNL